MKITLNMSFLILVSLNSCDFNGAKTTIPPDILTLEVNLNSPENIELGRQLFFDTRLSVDETISCSSCHKPEYAFTDQQQFSDGVAAHQSFRNSPSLLNSIFLTRLMFDAEIQTLEEQVLVPLQDTNEMGMIMSDLIDRLVQLPVYANAAQSIYGRKFDAFVLTRSLAAYERSLISMNSRFDQAERGETDRTIEEERGWKLFSKELHCTKCHPAPYFTTFNAENNGLYDNYGNDKGRFRINFDSTEIGFFKIPSLRNIELTFPYMHDGSINSLDDVLSHYALGGSHHVNKNSLIEPFRITQQDRVDLYLFLMSLTDTTYLMTTVE